MGGLGGGEGVRWDYHLLGQQMQELHQVHNGCSCCQKWQGRDSQTSTHGNEQALNVKFPGTLQLHLDQKLAPPGFGLLGMHLSTL